MDKYKQKEITKKRMFERNTRRHINEKYQKLEQKMKMKQSKTEQQQLYSI